MKAKYDANRIFLSILLSILSLLIIQCAVSPGPVFHKDGKYYGKIEGQWGGLWWNYYQRGLSYARGEYWDHAIRDLQDAIVQRSADQRRARTYGLHILDEYFPHRELGIIHYHQERFKEAISELETSLNQFESAKAKYFMNQARRGFLKETGLDRSDPTIHITFPKTGYLTRHSSLRVSGTAMDDQYVGAISVNTHEIPVELSGPEITFDQDIKLERGQNKVVVEVTDLLGRKVRREIVAWCDQEAPLIYIDQIVRDRSGESYTIEGYISDLSGVKDFQVNGLRVDLPDLRGGDFSVDLYLPDLMQPLILQAVDGLGNRTTGELRISEIFGQENTASHLPRLASCADNPKGLLSLNHIRLAFSETGDTPGPVVRIKDLPDHLTVDWEECFLEGEVRDLEGVKSITINGTPLITRTSKLVFFNFLVPLEVGDNAVMIEAESVSGEVESKRLSIERKLNDVQKIGSRLNLAILPIRYHGEREEIKDLVYESLIQYFVNQTRFQIVDRERVDGLLDRIKEKEMDKEEGKPSWIELGRLVSAEGVIVGSAYFFDDYLEILARAVDTETTVVLDSEEVFGPVQTLKDIHLLAEGLSLKFKQAFPMAEGHIVAMNNDTIQIDLGEKDRILPYSKVIFFREGEALKLPGSERIVEKRFIILGEGRIKKLYESSSETMLASGGDTIEIAVNDRVITK